MSTTPTRSLQLHMWWTAVLVLTALGGAGLAVAADRQQNPVQRPELTRAADGRAQPWIDALAAQLEQLHGHGTDLSTAGRAVLGQLQALDTAGANEALTAGDAAGREIDTFVAGLRDTRSQADAEIERWRLGPETGALLDQLDTAIAAAPELSTDWTALADNARAVVNLVDGLQNHDALVFEATTAGREGGWAHALELLGWAGDALGLATAMRDHLAATTTVETLDDLIGRARAYDEALTALYTYLRDGGRRSGTRFEALQAAVDQAQAALPGDTGVLVVIVGEAAGPPIADALVAMDEVHGTINDALLAVADARATPAP